MNRALTEWSKWSETIRVSWSERLVYKLNFCLMIIAPTLVFFFIKYNLWSSIYEMPGVRLIKGYSLDAMLQYQALVMITAFLSQGYNSMDLASDIRLGRMSKFLIYPFSFGKYHFGRFLALQAIQLAVAVVTLLLVLKSGVIAPLALDNLFCGFALTFCVSVMWFSICFILGLVAFWMEQTWVLRVMFLIVSQFLSGAIIPLDLFPGWLNQILQYLPFPFLTYVPVKVFSGEYSGNYIIALLSTLVWTFVFSGLAWVIWKRGVMRYTAAGM